MNIRGSSELARAQMLQRQVIETRNALETAGTEMTTGLKSDLYEATGGHLTRLFSIDRMLQRNAVYQETIGLVELRLDVAQEGLGNMLATAEEVSINLLTSSQQSDGVTALRHADAARQAFVEAVGKLNTRVAGQSIFAGTATSGPALAPAETILGDIDALVAGATDAATAAAAIDEYFRKDPAPAGAFFGAGYVGAEADMPAAEIGEGVRHDYALRADADQVVALLRSYALGAAVAGGALAGNRAEQMALLHEAGEQAVAAKEGILTLRARVGVSQNTVETAKAQRVSEQDTYALARTKLRTVDSYAAATRYTALESQLEMVFTVTARLSSLRFANYMR